MRRSGEGQDLSCPKAIANADLMHET